jgi:hypothetical protein
MLVLAKPERPAERFADEIAVHREVVDAGSSTRTTQSDKSR